MTREQMLKFRERRAKRLASLARPVQPKPRRTGGDWTAATPLGVEVWWSSQARGTRTTKRGTYVALWRKGEHIPNTGHRLHWPDYGQVATMDRPMVLVNDRIYRPWPGAVFVK